MRKSQLFAVLSLAACGSSDYDTNRSAVTGVDAATKPTSTITIRVEEARTNSILKTPAQVLQFCNIPKAVLEGMPLYKGDPAMAQCELRTIMTGDPPTSVEVRLTCDDGTNGWDTKVSLSCSRTLTLVPPKLTSSGTFYYGRKGVDLTKTCDDYLARAASICETTGVVAEVE